MQCTTLITAVVVLCNIIVPVVKASKCKGEHEYLDALGECQLCSRCGAGFEPSSHLCGFGHKDPSYKCVPCEEGSFSTSLDYKLCRTCQPCTGWNAKTESHCTSTKDAECGACHSGFFRPLMSDGKLDHECHKCTDPETPGCEGQEVIGLVLGVIGGVIFIILATSLCLWCLFRRRPVTKKQETQQCSVMLKCANNEDTITSSSLEPLTTTQSQELFVQQEGSPSSLKAQRSPDIRTMFVNPQNDTAPQQVVGHISVDPYTTHPTAQFDNLTSIRVGPASGYSQLPTAQFDQTQNSNRHHSWTDVVIRQGTNRYNNESLVSSRNDIHVESFDTNSVAASEVQELIDQRNPLPPIQDEQHAATSRKVTR